MGSWWIKIEAGERAGGIARWIRRHVPGMPRKRAEGLLKTEAVELNGEIVQDGTQEIRPDQVLRVSFNGRGDGRAFRRHRPHGFRPVYIDDDIAVVDKAAGVLTVPRHRNDPEASLRIGVSEFFELPVSRVRPVHRLDRFTTGLLIIALNPSSHGALVDQFGAGGVERRYLALVHGHPEPPEGKLTHWLLEDPRTYKQQVVRPGTKKAVRARLAYQTMESFPHASMLSVKLETGRRNQIRAQLATEGWPLLGERVYLSEEKPKRQRGPKLSRQALHASDLRFRHPMTGRPIEVHSDPPGDLGRWLAAQKKRTSGQ